MNSQISANKGIVVNKPQLLNKYKKTIYFFSARKTSAITRNPTPVTAGGVTLLVRPKYNINIPNRTRMMAAAFFIRLLVCGLNHQNFSAGR